MQGRELSIYNVTLPLKAGRSLGEERYSLTKNTEYKQAREGQTQHLAVKGVVHRLWCDYKIWHAGLNTVNAIP